MLERNPELGFSTLVQLLNIILADLHGGTDEPPTISASTVSRLLHELDYTWTVGVRFQRHKYTVENVERYVHHVFAALDIPFRHLKFLDEIHFVSKGTSSSLLCTI